MSDSKLKKFDTMGHRERHLLKDILKRIDTKSFDLMSNPVFKSGRDFITNMMNPQSDLYQKFESPFRRQYSEEIVPQIAEQFSAYDSQDSSAFKQALSQSASGLESNISNMRQGAMEGAAQQALGYAQAPGMMNQNMVNTALSSSGFGYQSIPGVEGWGQRMFGGIAGGASSLLGSYGMNKTNQWMQSSSTPSSTGGILNTQDYGEY